MMIDKSRTAKVTLTTAVGQESLSIGYLQAPVLCPTRDTCCNSVPGTWGNMIPVVSCGYLLGVFSRCYLLGVFSKSNKIKEHQADQQIFSFKSRDEESQRKLQCLRWSIHSSTFGVEHWYSVSKKNTTMDTKSDGHLIYTTPNVHHSSNIWCLLSLSLTVSLGLSCCRWVSKPIQYLGFRDVQTAAEPLPTTPLTWTTVI